MDQIKASFLKVKQDIDSMKEEIHLLKQSLSKSAEDFFRLNETIRDLTSQLSKINIKETSGTPAHTPTDNLQNPAHPAHTPTDNLQNPAHPAHTPTDNLPLKPLKGQNMGISTGNGGVPTDRQTDRQTNQHMEKTDFGDALEILNSLDNIKKEIRNKFKRITDQEFLVFSTIYQMAEEIGYTDYKSLSQKLNLTESSIRDYVGRLMKKGIPVEKIKINNKVIHLSISEKLKKIVSLPTIFQLREL